MPLTLADHNPTMYCPDCGREHVCDLCHDTGILVKVHVDRMGTWVTADSCDCPSLYLLDSGLRGLLGTYAYELPEALRAHLESTP